MHLNVEPMALLASNDIAGVTFGAPSWIVPSVILFLIIGGAVAWSYSAKNTIPPVRLIAAILKLIAIGLLAICLLQPMRSGTRPRPKANVFSIVVDNSQSMRLKPSTESLSRGEKVAQLLEDKNDWRTRLAQAFDVRSYAFDSRLERVDQFDQLSSEGYVSSMTGSLQSLSERLADRPVAGTLLFTDGNLTDMPPDYDWSELGIPLYPVLPSDDEPIRDLRIADVSLQQTDFETSPTTLRVQVDSVGMESDATIVQLRDESGQLIEEKTVSTTESEPEGEVTFRFRPEQSGVNFYNVVTFSESERSVFEPAKPDEAKPETSEATIANNSRVVAVDRKHGPYRVLYVAGRPNWEFKFLRRALQEDAEVQLVGLLRIANKEPKFSFRDQAVNSTNRLFQGLDNDEEEAAQQYDEPVIIRLGVKESEELSDGFPESADELFAYHGVILDDVETKFFSPDQMLLLRRFVSTRGGGLLFLGGKESFAGKEFADSPLGELAPVYAPRKTVENKPGAFRLAITREGLLQPWVRLRDNESAEKDRLKGMPPFSTINAVGDPKPGASVLATVSDKSTNKSNPALVVQRFGKGRSAAMPIGDFWRWSMRREKEGRDDPAQMWRQTTRWLVNEVPRRAEIRVDAGSDPSQPVTIVATARDEDYLPLDNAAVTLEITRLGKEPFEIVAEADDNIPGVYKADYWSRDPGGYKVSAKISAADGSDVGTASTGWTVQAGVAEFQDLRLNRNLLTRIANETGGEVVSEDRLDQFVTELPDKKIPVTETWVYPIWHRPWVLCLAVLCLCTEWGLRRWKGLA